MTEKLSSNWFGLIGIVVIPIIWYFGIYPFGGTWTIDGMNINFFAFTLLFANVIAQALVEREDYRVAFVVTLFATLCDLSWIMLTKFSLSIVALLIIMLMNFLLSYKKYPVNREQR
ncbi:MAG: hypothetical protein PHE67_05800 [Campylobacterales bacterium]|nr:hypothetical protein [Campylobacterales bacterium]